MVLSIALFALFALFFYTHLLLQSNPSRTETVRACSSLFLSFFFLSCVQYGVVLVYIFSFSNGGLLTRTRFGLYVHYTYKRKQKRMKRNCGELISISSLSILSR
ncbi:uncharacterized protein EI90DRAFT_3052304, partial [Cantharellus anzutake]|uniref:uncharacterized protein n=1 Tax=Cantharellus anzutake TaxID=1750568 RepID=UPI0019058D9A